MHLTVICQGILIGLLLKVTCITGFWPETSTEESCMDECLKRGYDYYWCHTESSWGYCSPFNNMSSSGKTCRRKHPCRYIRPESKYMQCELDDGGIDYCGLNKYVDIHSISTNYDAFCTDECAKRGYNYYWCHTFKGWDYCSPFRDVTVNGVPCRADHYCAKHSYQYHWCYTDKSWDYCSPVVDCSYWPAEDQLGNKTNCVITKKMQNITLEYEPDITIDQARHHHLRQKALLLIDDWTYDKIDRNQKRGTMFKRKALRIDQGYANGRDFAMILLQMNETHDIPGTGSTLAKVLLPTDITVNYQTVRRALVNSLNQRERVTVHIVPNYN